MQFWERGCGKRAGRGNGKDEKKNCHRPKWWKIVSLVWRGPSFPGECERGKGNSRGKKWCLYPRKKNTAVAKTQSPKQEKERPGFCILRGRDTRRVLLAKGAQSREG